MYKIALVDDDLILKKGRPNANGSGIGLLGVWLEEHLGASNVKCYQLGSEIIKAIQQDAYRFDLVLIDFELSNNDGQYKDAIQLGEAILEIAPYLALVILSNHNSFSKCRETLKSGFTDFIPKIDVMESKTSFLKEIDALFQLPTFKQKQSFKQLSFSRTWDEHLKELNQKAKEEIDWYAYTLVRWLLVSKLLKAPLLNDNGPSAIKSRLPTMEKLCEDYCNTRYPSANKLNFSGISRKGKVSSKRTDTLEKWLPIIVKEFALVPLTSDEVIFIKNNSQNSNTWATHLSELKNKQRIREGATWLLSAEEQSVLKYCARETLAAQFTAYHTEKIISSFQFLAAEIPNIGHIAKLVKQQIVPTPDNLD